MEIGLKWVHMAGYELILRLDGALWLPIISEPLLTPKRGAPGVGQAVYTKVWLGPVPQLYINMA